MISIAQAIKDYVRNRREEKKLPPWDDPVPWEKGTNLFIEVKKGLGM